MINTPRDKAFGYPSIMVHGPMFKKYLNPVVPGETLKSLTNVFYNKLPYDVGIMLTRNQQIKDQVFYDLIKNNEIKTMCIRIDEKGDANSVSIDLPIMTFNYVSQRDMWLIDPMKSNELENFENEAYQTIHVTKSDQFA